MKRSFYTLSVWLWGMMLLFTGALPAARAQKFGLETVKVKYVRLPLQPLGKEVKNCYSKVIIPQKREDPQYQNYRVAVKGLKYVNDPSQAQLRVEVDFREFVGLDPRLVSKDVYRVNTGQNEKGYYYELQYDFPSGLVVSTPDHRVLLNRQLRPDSSARFMKYGMWTFSREELDSKYADESAAITQRIFNACIQSVLKQAKEIVNSQFAFTPVTYRQKIAVLKSKKTPFYKDFQKAAELTKVAFDVDSYAPGGGSDHTLQQALDLWKKVVDDPSGKAGGKVKMLAYYNMAAVSRWMNRFDEADSYARKAAEGITPETAKRMAPLIMSLPEEIRTRKERYKVNDER
jgi:hypothetical protein